MSHANFWKIWLFVLMAVIASEGSKAVLKLGLITPATGDLGFERVAAATTMGIDQAHQDGYLSNTDVR